MDLWKFFDITHRYHRLCNPMTLEKIDEVFNLLRLSPGAGVLDIACGKAELLIKLAEMYGITGVGVDLSPYCVQEANKKHLQRTPDAALEFICLDGAKYRPEKPGSFDLAMCIGASWIWSGHQGTLLALAEMTKPGGLIMVGESFWSKDPPQEYLDSEKLKYEDFGSHHDNVLIAEEQGLTFLYSVVSSLDDWDRYEGLRWYAAAEYARTNPCDPDLPKVIERATRSREIYLRWGRDCLGWAIYLFRKP